MFNNTRLSEWLIKRFICVPNAWLGIHQQLPWTLTDGQSGYFQNVWIILALTRSGELSLLLVEHRHTNLDVQSKHLRASLGINQADRNKEPVKRITHEAESLLIFQLVILQSTFTSAFSHTLCCTKRSWSGFLVNFYGQPLCLSRDVVSYSFVISCKLEQPITSIMTHEAK